MEQPASLSREEMIQAIVDAAQVERELIEGLPDDLLKMHYERFCGAHEPNFVSPAMMLQEQERIRRWVAAGNNLWDYDPEVFDEG